MTMASLPLTVSTMGWVKIVGRSTLCCDGEEEDEEERSEEEGEVTAIY